METEDKVNPYNGKPYSDTYYKILKTRQSLPVWERKEEFLKYFEKHQIIILQGETGSGKTTQVCLFSADDFDYLISVIRFHSLLLNVISFQRNDKLLVLNPEESLQ